MSVYNTMNRFRYPQNVPQNDPPVNFPNKTTQNYNQGRQQNTNHNFKTQQVAEDSKFFTKTQPVPFQPRNPAANQEYMAKPSGNIFKLPTPRPRFPPQEINVNYPTAQNTKFNTTNLNSTLNSSFNTTVSERISFKDKSTASTANYSHFEGPSTSKIESTASFQRKKTEEESVKYLTGNIEKVLQWHKLLNEFCHYEVIGPMISLQEGFVRLQKVLLLRDRTGPVLKIVHYVHDRINLPNFYMGQIIRCVGRMIGPNTLQAVHIREASAAEIQTLPRISYICDQEVRRIYYLN